MASGQSLEHVWCQVGNGLSNQTFIEGPEGLIVIDTGESIEEMNASLSAVREYCSAPVAAVIYTHAEENLQARIRGNFIMAISNKFSWLVLSTGNKSEIATGYATLYGDMAGGFSVLKDVPKTMVYDLSNFINTKKEIIPKNIIKKPPSAELKPDQYDQDTLPDYNTLDMIIELYVEKKESFKKIISNKEIRKNISEEKILEILKMIDRNEYKRRQSPPGIKITSLAFGRDRRYPLASDHKSNWKDEIGKFKKVIPRDYAKILDQKEAKRKEKING